MPDADAVGLLVRQHEEIHRLRREVETSTGARQAETFEARLAEYTRGRRMPPTWFAWTLRDLIRNAPACR